MQRIARAKYIVGRPTHSPRYNKRYSHYKKLKRDDTAEKDDSKNKDDKQTNSKQTEKDKSEDQEESVTIPTSSTVMTNSLQSSAICPDLARCKTFNFRARDKAQNSEENMAIPKRKFLLLLN
ncbi:unnamed protein product [Arctia plantaginis]|uniref:Uncharacterized protein n=1 Tax=Arctia plantaginis TaxID=874455 RepID=A0A8S1ABH6_ARCPL|nr:unnamed protein product [Arctia plantaginis]